MLLLPVIYWCLDKHLGARLGALFLGSVLLNFFLKDLFMLPRPEGNQVRILYPESGGGYGFPSGHAQGNTTVWGYLMSRYPGRAFWALGLTIIFLVSLSRLYLGVHYPSDVVGGVALAVALIVAFNRIIEPQAARLSWKHKMALAAVLPLAAAAVYRQPDGYMLAGLLWGLGTGYLAESRLVRWEPEALYWQQAVKLALGLLVFFGLRVATSPLFPPGPPQIFRFALIGGWVSLAAPCLFARLGLALKSRG